MNFCSLPLGVKKKRHPTISVIDAVQAYSESHRRRSLYYGSRCNTSDRKHGNTRKNSEEYIVGDSSHRSKKQ